MKRIVMILSVMAVVLSGCGGSDGPTPAEKRAAAEAKASEEAAEEEAAREEAVQQAQATCESNVADFKTALEALQSKLSVGMTQNDFNTELGNVKVLYDQMDIDAIAEDPYCLEKVGKPLEDAFQNYIKSNSAWADCINNYGCDVDRDKMKGMQKRWSEAGVQILIADTVLKNYEAPTAAS